MTDKTVTVAKGNQSCSSWEFNWSWQRELELQNYACCYCMLGLRLQCSFVWLLETLKRFTVKSCYELLSSFRTVEAADGVFLSVVNQLCSISAPSKMCFRMETTSRQGFNKSGIMEKRSDQWHSSTKLCLLFQWNWDYGTFVCELSKNKGELEIGL
jgi:hypothetical protein